MVERQGPGGIHIPGNHELFNKDYREFAARFRIPCPETFTIVPLNSSFCLLHWRVLLGILAFTTRTVRQLVRVLNPNIPYEPETRGASGYQPSAPGSYAHRVQNTSNKRIMSVKPGAVPPKRPTLRTVADSPPRPTSHLLTAYSTSSVLTDAHFHLKKLASQARLALNVSGEYDFSAIEAKVSSVVPTPKIPLKVAVSCDQINPGDLNVAITSDPRVYYCTGIHPAHCKSDWSEMTVARLLDFLVLNLKRPYTVGVGEIGLDYFRGKSPEVRQFQRDMLRATICD